MMIAPAECFRVGCGRNCVCMRQPLHVAQTLQIWPHHSDDPPAYTRTATHTHSPLTRPPLPPLALLSLSALALSAAALSCHEHASTARAAPPLHLGGVASLAATMYAVLAICCPPCAADARLSAAAPSSLELAAAAAVPSPRAPLPYDARSNDRSATRDDRWDCCAAQRQL